MEAYLKYGNKSVAHRTFDGLPFLGFDLEESFHRSLFQSPASGTLSRANHLNHSASVACRIMNAFPEVVSHYRVLDFGFRVSVRGFGARYLKAQWHGLARKHYFQTRHSDSSGLSSISVAYRTWKEFPFPRLQRLVPVVRFRVLGAGLWESFREKPPVGIQ